MGVDYSCLFEIRLLGGYLSYNKFRMVPPFLLTQNIMPLGSRMLYKATYTKKNGTLPYGVEFQFISDRYKAEDLLFKSRIIPSNLEKEIVSACISQYGIDVTNDFRFDAGRAFQVECLTVNQKYKINETFSSTNTTQSEEMGCLSSLKHLLWNIVKAFIWTIVLIIMLFIAFIIFSK